MNRKKLKLNKGLAATPLALALAACGGGEEVPTVPVIPTDPDDNGVNTGVVLDYFSNHYHGDFVLNTIDEVTEAEVVGENRQSNKVSQTDEELIRTDETHEPEVINMSTGTSLVATDRGITQSSYQDLTDVSLDLFREGTIVVASAGNEGSFGVSASRSPSVFQYAIGATEDDGTITDYSNYHPKEVDFYAYGNSAPTDYQVYDKTYVVILSGTSFSSPRVAGHINELLGHDPDYTYSEIRTLLEYNSEYLEHESGFVYQYLDKINQYEHVIDTRVIVEAGFELFDGRNPTQAELDLWVERIDSEEYTFVDLEDLLSNNGVHVDEVADVELAQAHFHWNFHRESTDNELLDRLVEMEEVTEFAQLILPYEQIQIIQTPDQIIA